MFVFLNNCYHMFPYFYFCLCLCLSLSLSLSLILNLLWAQQSPLSLCVLLSFSKCIFLSRQAEMFVSFHEIPMLLSGTHVKPHLFARKFINDDWCMCLYFSFDVGRSKSANGKCFFLLCDWWNYVTIASLFLFLTLFCLDSIVWCNFDFCFGLLPRNFSGSNSDL